MPEQPFDYAGWPYEEGVICRGNNSRFRGAADAGDTTAIAESSSVNSRTSTTPLVVGISTPNFSALRGMAITGRQPASENPRPRGL
jgi:hypothetical protein